MTDMSAEERAESISEWWVDAQHSEQWGELRETLTEAIHQAEAAAVEREACARVARSFWRPESSSTIGDIIPPVPRDGGV